MLTEITWETYALPQIKVGSRAGRSRTASKFSLMLFRYLLARSQKIQSF